MKRFFLLILLAPFIGDAQTVVTINGLSQVMNLTANQICASGGTLAICSPFASTSGFTIDTSANIGAANVTAAGNIAGYSLTSQPSVAATGQDCLNNIAKTYSACITPDVDPTVAQIWYLRASITATTADYLVGENAAQTLSNKTFNVPTINGILLNALVTNETVTGTTINLLAYNLNSSGSKVKVVPAASQGIVPMGVCVSGCSNTGVASIQTTGNVSCVYDNSVIGGDPMGPSTSTLGNCHDYPTINAAMAAGVCVLGTAQTTNTSGTRTVKLWNAPLCPQPNVSIGTTFTNASGCGTTTSLTGGPLAGSFLAGQTGCVPVITTGLTAPNGYVCTVWDITTNTDTLKETAYSQTTVTFSGTVVNGDKVAFSCTMF